MRRNDKPFIPNGCPQFERADKDIPTPASGMPVDVLSFLFEVEHNPDGSLEVAGNFYYPAEETTPTNDWDLYANVVTLHVEPGSDLVGIVKKLEEYGFRSKAVMEQLFGNRIDTCRLTADYECGALGPGAMEEVVRETYRLSQELPEMPDL